MVKNNLQLSVLEKSRMAIDKKNVEYLRLLVLNFRKAIEIAGTQNISNDFLRNFQLANVETQVIYWHNI